MVRFKNYPFSELSFSSLFCTYTSNFVQVAPFYESNPFHPQAVAAKANNFVFDGDRNETAKLLLNFNRQFDADEAAITNIKRLKSEDALTIVTGQQLGLFGGPVYTFYKILTTIQQSRQLERALDRPVVPVFWLADEDHDYDEVRSVNVLNSNGIEAFSLPRDLSGMPVSEIEYPDQLNELKKQLRSALVDTDFTGGLWNLIDECFIPERTFLKSFGSFISRLFSKHGLVLAGSNNRAIKHHTKQCLADSVRHTDAIHEALKKQTEKLEDFFHQQVKLYDSHFFYLSESEGRTKINRDKKGWRTDNGRTWTTEQLLNEIDQKPEQFSPDVFLRPILQDKLLPTLGYVAGPGEIAYYGQMKLFYKTFGMKMPVIFPRLSATFVEPAIVRIFRELPFEIAEYQNRIEDLESDFVDRTENFDIERLFEDWKVGIDDLSVFHTKWIKKIDDTLEGASKKAEAHYVNELKKLKGKVYRAVKDREQTQLKRIHRIQRHLFPKRNLQERTLSGIYYMNKFGIDIWDRLLEKLDEEESFTDHKLTYL